MESWTSARIRLPVGVRDFLPQAAARRRAISSRVMDELERWGFERIITPLFECADVLERGLGEDARAAAIRFVEPLTGEIVALRPDITPQVARLVVTRMAEVDGPIRLCYEGRVARMAAGARGQREIMQAGVELYGAPSPEGDIEVVALAAAALARAGMPDARLEVGHVCLARHVLEGLDDRAMRDHLETALRKKDRAAVAEVAAVLPRRLRELACQLPTLFGDPGRVLSKARELSIPASCKRALDRLEQVIETTSAQVRQALGTPLTIELGEVRGFDYYTGLRLAGYAPGLGDAVLLGGRYDQLAARYGRALPAVGFAIDIEAVAESQTAVEPSGHGGVLVVATTAGRKDAERLARGLRQAGMRAAVDLGRSRSRAATREYAERTGFTSVVEFGPRGVFWIEGETVRPLARRALTRAFAGDPSGLSGGRA